MRIFGWSLVFSAIAVVVGFLYGGIQAALLVLLLVVFETTLSADNALINARIVEKLSDFWAKMFLSVGVIIAVFGMRLLFPLIIVGVTTGLNPVQAFSLAMEKGDPHVEGTYGYILTAAHPQVAAFGGMFLLMLFLDFIFDTEREIHWLHWIEAPLAKIGKLDIASVIVGLGVLLTMASVAHEHATIVLVSGIAGMITYLLVNALGSVFESRLEEDEEQSNISGITKLVGKAAFASFLYLEILDASFSFDGVIGSLALTTDPIIIALGLGAGAMFVRSITIFLVRKGTLNDYVYLDHGAHWAIGALAVLLIVSIATPVPEVVTGLVGLVLIIAALISSVIYNKKQSALEVLSEEPSDSGVLTK